MTFAIDTPHTQSSRAVVERYLAALQAGDERAVRNLFDVDATWELRSDLPIAGTWRGRDAILNDFLATARGHFEPGSIELEATAIVAEDDRVVLEWVSRARTRHGVPYENHCAGVFTVRDGRIQGVREYMDTLYAHRVVFSAPTPAVTVAQLLQAPDSDALNALLADDVVFHSPVADYHGRGHVSALLSLIPTVLDDVRVRRQLPSERELVSFLTASVDEQRLDGVVHERYDDVGRACEVTLMLRPLSALRVAVASVGVALDATGY